MVKQVIRLHRPKVSGCAVTGCTEPDQLLALVECHAGHSVRRRCATNYIARLVCWRFPPDSNTFAPISAGKTRPVARLILICFITQTPCRALHLSMSFPSSFSTEGVVSSRATLITGQRLCTVFIFRVVKDCRCFVAMDVLLGNALYLVNRYYLIIFKITKNFQKVGKR